MIAHAERGVLRVLLNSVPATVALRRRDDLDGNAVDHQATGSARKNGSRSYVVASILYVLGECVLGESGRPE